MLLPLLSMSLVIKILSSDDDNASNDDDDSATHAQSSAGPGPCPQLGHAGQDLVSQLIFPHQIPLSSARFRCR
jgi:hypothetical protein